MRCLILLALVGAACAAGSSRVVGGEAADITSYPFMASLQVRLFNEVFLHTGGATLLNENTVLTSAHLLNGAAENNRVRVGSSSNIAGGEVVAVAAYTQHPQYDSPRLDSDVALLRLATLLVFGPTVGAAAIPAADYPLADGLDVTVLGWGSLSYNGEYPEQLQAGRVRVVNQQLCRQRYADLKQQPGYGNYPEVSDNMVCHGLVDEGGVEACQGDAGGPLLYAGLVVVGVKSWSEGCASAVYPGVSARVSQFSQWIQDTNNSQ